MVGPEAFPQAALDPVPGHGVACFLADGKPDLQLTARGREQNQVTAGHRMPLAVDILEGPVLLQPITSLHCWFIIHPLQADSPLVYEEKPAHWKTGGLHPQSY